MKNRFAFKCWNCKREYTLFKEITEEQVLIVPCPFCNKEAIVKLELYKKEAKTIFRGLEDGEQAVGYEYDFPEVIPTEEPDQD